MTLINAAQLRQFSMRCDYQALAPMLNQALAEARINTGRRIRHFMATIHVESAGLTEFEENLHYSAKRLTAVWPSRFPTLEAAAPFAMRPIALANRVYGGRMGNSAAGDGWKYRGRGLIGLTGKDNYRRAGLWTGVDLVASPEKAADKALACRIAAQWWKANGLNQIVDEDPGEKPFAADVARILANESDDLVQARRRVNGGTTGMKHVQDQLLRGAFIWGM